MKASMTPPRIFPPRSEFREPSAGATKSWLFRRLCAPAFFPPHAFHRRERRAIIFAHKFERRRSAASRTLGGDAAVSDRAAGYLTFGCVVLFMAKSSGRS